jgi:hypothetical protein
MKVLIELENNKQLDRFIEFAEKVITLNKKLKLKQLKITFKYDMRSHGEFNDDEPNKIKLNPERCEHTGEWSLFLIAMHEFSHLIDDRFKMLSFYEKEFEEEQYRLPLTTYSKTSVEEELAEVISAYLLYPYFLKSISAKHYNFIKRFIKSPKECTKKEFMKDYERWSKKHKEKMKNKYGFYLETN